MRYLLDEMYPGVLGKTMRSRDLGVIAVQEEPGLMGLSDEELFAVAQLSGRVLVTENARDYVNIEASWRAEGGQHSGLVLTSNRSFPRHDPKGFVRDFSGALVALDRGPDPVGSFVRWLHRS